MQDLGTLPDGDDALAAGCSADGSVVVGHASTIIDDWMEVWHAFRWTEAGGMQDLGTLPGYEWSGATEVSADGGTVVGVVTIAGNWYAGHAFRWTEAGGMQDLGTLPGGCCSNAFDVSADGSIVIGTAADAAEQWHAFRWTVLGGMEDLNLTYADLLTDGSVLTSANAISPDGRYIVGHGYNAATGRYEAYLLDTGPRCTAHSGDVDGNGCVDDADLLAVLIAFGNTGGNLGRVDTNCDGVVDDADLLIVLINFGSGC
jgi:probable HAF family extracellular repeat protein